MCTRPVGNKLWSWIYGTTLIVIGVLLGVWAVVRVVQGRESGVVFAFSLATNVFVAFGAVVLGIERIRGRGWPKLRPFVRPDETLVEKYGPKGEKFK